MIVLRIDVLVHDLQSHDYCMTGTTSTSPSILPHNLMSFAWIDMALVPIFSDFYILSCYALII
jgi:hypothetical protein